MEKVHPIDQMVGQRVRLARIERGMSQTELATKVGITFQQIQKYERGTNRVSASRLFDIARVLKLEVAWFFKDPPADVAHVLKAEELNLPVFSRVEIRALKKLAGLNPQVRRGLFAIIDALDGSQETESSTEEPTPGAPEPGKDLTSKIQQ